MASENESFNLEDLPIFLNSVLERAEFICHEKVIDLSNVETHLQIYRNRVGNRQNVHLLHQSHTN